MKPSIESEVLELIGIAAVIIVGVVLIFRGILKDCSEEMESDFETITERNKRETRD